MKAHSKPVIPKASAEAEATRGEREIRCFLGMPAVIVSARMRKMMRFVEQIANSAAAVLITGESGAGKELVARALHVHSPRCGNSWIDINCAALPDHLLESELFGYEKGAFSGADSAKPGIFELANHGTLFLDEIAELSLRSQGKLLRVLDGYPHYRLGGTRKVEVDVRIIAATNSDLPRVVRAGKFRQDLYHRLNQLCVAVPPLRERGDDIGPLAEFFLNREKDGLTISADAVTALEGYSWPGNVRELRSLMARMAATVEGSQIRSQDLPLEFQASPQQDEPSSNYSLERLEQEVIFQALEQSEGRRKEAADLLGISSRTLMRRLKTYGADPGRSLACDGRDWN